MERVTRDELANARQKILSQLISVDKATQAKHYKDLVAFNNSPVAYDTDRVIPRMWLWRFAAKLLFVLNWTQIIMVGVIIWQAFSTDWRSVFAIPIVVVLYLLINFGQNYVNIEIGTRLVSYAGMQLSESERAALAKELVERTGQR